MEDDEERLRDERRAQSGSSGIEERREALEVGRFLDALGGVMSR